MTTPYSLAHMTPIRLRRGRACDVGRTRWLFVSLALVVLIAAGGFAAYQFDALDRLIGDSDDESALDVEPPERLEFPQARSAQPVLGAAQPAGLRAAAAEDAVRKVLKKRTMGKHTGVAVTSLGANGPAVSIGSGNFVPASTLKNFTSLAALKSLGRDARFTTSVVRSSGSGSAPTITLVGGGDPLLATKKPDDSDAVYPEPATLADLADRTAKSLGRDGVHKVQLRFDDSLFEGPDVSPRWEDSYISTDVTTPVSALWVDEGIDPKSGERTTEPASAAAETFAELLGTRGIKVKGKVDRRAADKSATEVAAVQSPPLSAIVQHLLEESDNESAEVVLRHLALSENRPASFEGGTAAMKSVLTSMGVPWSGVTVYDGSGLSRDNRVTLRAELAVLRLAATSSDQDARAMIGGLPVAGFNGSLVERFTSSTSYDGLGLARAKTGTLSGVHGYAGITTDKSGTPLLFVALANQVKDKNALEAQAGLDDIAAALSSCACSR